MDAPNIRCAITNLCGQQPREVDLDLRRLREWYRDSLLIQKQLFITRYHDPRSMKNLKTLVRRSHWKFLSVKEPTFGHNTDPVDDLIIQRVIDVTNQVPDPAKFTISVVSHDGVYADYLKRFLDKGGYVAVVGFISRLSGKLYRLERYERAELFDLDFDPGAITRTRQLGLQPVAQENEGKIGRYASVTPG